MICLPRVRSKYPQVNAKRFVRKLADKILTEKPAKATAAVTAEEKSESSSKTYLQKFHT